MELIPSFGEWVQRRRRSLALSGARLAAQIGVAEITIRKIEADERRPSVQIAQLLAQHLGIPADQHERFVQVARGVLSIAHLPPPIPALLSQPFNHAATQATPDLPSGTVTFLFTDIEGSTRLWEQDRAAMDIALQRHDAVLRAAIAAYRGHVFKTVGDAFCAVFEAPHQALHAALDAQRALQHEDWAALGLSAALRVRMALHTGVPEVRDDDFFGPPLNQVARLLTVGHGGQILVSSATEELLRDDLPPDTKLQTLGMHFVRDLSGPRTLFQVMAPGLISAFPPLRTLNIARGNLPARLTSFHGRDRELAAVIDLLQQPHSRLLTLTGAGGTGKTRLALTVADTLSDRYDDGVWFVDLAPISDSKLVALAIGQTLGIAEDSNVPPRERLCVWLRSRSLLLLLDNFEQVLEAASLVSEILNVAPHVTVLVTSRLPLRVQGEREYPVAPLECPPIFGMQGSASRAQDVEAGIEAEPVPSDLSQYAAVALFIARARAVRPDFAVTNRNAPAVAEICARLDGLPLAIELAAARIRLFTPDMLLHRLRGEVLPLLTGGPRDAPARQQTIRATIEWSYRLLSPAQQQMFRALGVFIGGWKLEGAEAVVHEQKPEPPTANLLETLVEQSMVRVVGPEEAPRYTMLETLREYALEQLAETGELAEARQRHAQYFADLALDGESALWGPRQLELLDRFDAELGNVRAASLWLIETGRVDDAALLAAALGDFWVIRCRFQDGAHLLEAAFARTELTPAVSAKVHLALANIYREMEQFKRGREHSARCLQIYRTLGDTRGIARAGAAYGLGLVWPSPDPALLVPVLEETLAAARSVGDLRAEADALLWYGWMEATRGQHAQARPLLERAQTLHRRIGSPHGIAWLLSMLHTLAREEGNYPVAYELRRESLDIMETLRSPRGIAITHENLREIAILMWEHERALAHSHEQLAVSLAAGLTVPAIRAYAALSATSLVIGLESDALAYAERGLELARATCANDEELSRTEMLATYAETLLAVGRLDEAESILHEVLAIDEVLQEQRMILIDHELLGDVMLARRNFEAARTRYTEAIVIAERIGLWNWAAHMLRMRGLAAIRVGNPEVGIVDLRESCSRLGEQINLIGQANIAGAFGEYALAQGDTERATRLFGFSAAVRELTRTQLYPVWRAVRERCLVSCRAALGEAVYTAHWEAGRARTWEEMRQDRES
jgi:predicted ATPase/class 3 adenylate cyclase/DNA-binding XRE family transcriptional regulator/predicted negative regulator of RcsB-dependent stress response